jgi:hypothetical protein
MSNSGTFPSPRQAGGQARIVSANKNTNSTHFVILSRQFGLRSSQCGRPPTASVAPSCGCFFPAMRPSVMNVGAIGLDVAKTIFQVHGGRRAGRGRRCEAAGRKRTIAAPIAASGHEPPPKAEYMTAPVQPPEPSKPLRTGGPSIRDGETGCGPATAKPLRNQPQQSFMPSSTLIEGTPGTG